jgi:hypothetical protein
MSNDAKQLKELRLEFLNETINFFNSTNRSFKNKGCHYYLEGKDGCAIGRKITDKDLCRELDKMLDSSVSNIEVFESLPMELKILGMTFLKKVQLLHDIGTHWDEHGISESGKQYVNEIKEFFSLN